MERAATPKHARHYRFPDSAWWIPRCVARPIPRYKIDRRPEAAAEYGTTAETVVRRIVERIVERFDPIAVWLFGSMARGNVHKHSDVDLMVIVPEDAYSDTIDVDMGLEVSGSLLPKDILVNTPEQWESKMRDVGSVQRAVRMRGVMLYG